MIYRLFDIFIVILIFPFLALLIIFISIGVFLSAGLPIFHISRRIGVGNKYFNMPKFRTMKLGTPNVATDLLESPNLYISNRFCKFLRISSLDELPQFYSVLIGEMSLVGPRPALFNQTDLIELREIYGINKIKPGITGYAQIKGRDSISINKKVELEIFYLNNKSIFLYFYILGATLIQAIFFNKVSH